MFEISTILLIILAQESGLSAVTETDQEFERSYGGKVENWAHSGRPGLFMSDGFNKTENTTFHVKEAGVYYVSANLIIETKKKRSYYYYYYSSTVTLNGHIDLKSEKGYSVDYGKEISTYVTMGEYEQRNLRISGYVQLERGWQVSIQVLNGYRWGRSVKVGSTLSIMYVSKPSMFPGVLLKNEYEYLYLNYPGYSANVVDWNEIDEGSTFPVSEGNFMVPHNGLYHILVNLNVRRYNADLLKFAILISNKTEAITKTMKLESSGIHTITLEGILDLIENQTISITISSATSEHTHITVVATSKFFIFSKGTLSPSTPAISTTYQSTSTQLPADIWSKLNKWDLTSKHPLNHYTSVQLQDGEFVAPKHGIYQITIALYLSNCTTAEAKLSLKTSTDSLYQATSPDISFTQETNDCYLQNSLLLNLDKNDTLRLEVKSDTKYTVLSQTSYQVVFQTTYTLWPSAILQLIKSFQFDTNSAAVKVHDWSHTNEGNWNDLFFNVNKQNIQIKSPGLYLVSYNLVVNTIKSGAQFYSQVIVNGALVADGSKCQRGSAPQLFTCTVSTLLNLIEKDTLAAQVWMKDGTKKKQSVQILTSSRMTVTLLGDARSHPAFKLNAKPPAKPYTTKAKATDMKSLTDFTSPNTSFFQSAAIYSNDEKTFNTGKNNAFFLLNNVQFNLQSDGYLAAVVGSEGTNMVAYSKDHKKSQFSVSASDLSVDTQFYFNVSAEASKSDFKWQPESGSVVSGIHTGTKDTMTSLKAQLKPNAKLQCSTQWTLIGVKDWTLLMHLNNLGKITSTGIQISKSGFYLTSLNFAVKSNTSNTIINVGIFIDQQIILSASETSPGDGKFSVFLQGILELKSGQDIDIKVKCDTSTELTYAKGGGIFAFNVDVPQIRPGMRKQFKANYINSGEIGTFYPRYSYNNDDTFEQFRQDIVFNDWRITVPRSGVYLITVVGYVQDNTWWYSSYTADNFELAFSSPANKSENASRCSIDSSPLYFKDTSDKVDKPLALTGFVSLDKDEIAGFVGRYDYWGLNYNSRLYMSIQFMGDITSSSGFTATLHKDTTLAKGQNQLLKDKAWISGKTCGKYTTKDVPVQFGKYKVLYTGFYVVALNLVLNHKDNCDFGFCFTVNGKSIADIGGSKGLYVGCFNQRLQNQSSTTTVSGSELLYLEARQELSVQMTTNLGLTISKKSSFSAFYLGTAGAMVGISSVIATKVAEKRELPNQGSRYYRYYYHYYDNDDDEQFVIQGWKTNVPNTKMFFQNGLKIPLDDVFVSPQDGVYMVLVKLRVEGKSQTNETCEVKLELAVDGETLDFAYKKDFGGSVNTLSFTTTLRLEKWQGVTVRFTRKRIECEKMEIAAGSTFAVVYLDSGKKAFTLWPNIGPHIVEFPSVNRVYVREDKSTSGMVTCRAVGEYPIKYEWKTYDDEVLSESSILDTRKLNDSTSDVQCVVTMKGLVAESRFVTIKAIDPTVIFSDTYNRTYNLPEKNSTHHSGYRDVLVFGASEKKPGYYYWRWNRRISCSITKGNINDTFTVTDEYYYYGYGDDDQYFKLRARLAQLDREAISEYKLEITCENIEYTDAATATTTIDVVILDANDNLPVFEKEIYTAKIPRSIRPGEDIIQVIATDDDINENGKITYTLVSSSDSYIFNIDRKIGVISLKEYEQLSKPYYRLTVVATDQGKPPRSAYVTVALEVDMQIPSANHTNRNPIFPVQVHNVFLIWGTSKGTYVTTVHAHDPDTFDHRSIRYYIFSGSDSVFEVDPKRGVIKTKGEITKGEYHLEIAAEYEYKPGQSWKPGEYYNTTLVIVLVRKVDTSRPNFVLQHYKARIRENAKINSEVVTVKAVYDGKPVEYWLPTHRGIFKIDKSTGNITLAGKLDYETQQDHTFVVSVKDPKHDTKSSCVDVTVHVQDVNDNAPIITQYKKEIRVEMGKGPREIGHIFASDKDTGTNGEIKYYLDYDGSIDYGFSIDHDNGTLYTDGHPDCCDVIYGLTVVAKDQGIPPLEDEVQIEIIPYDDGGGGGHHPQTGKSSDQKIYIIAGVVGGVAIIIIIAGVLYWRRRRRQRDYASATMNYMNLPSDEEDDDLLDAGSDHDNNEENSRRLSLISAASDDNLLRNEAPC